MILDFDQNPKMDKINLAGQNFISMKRTAHLKLNLGWAEHYGCVRIMLIPNYIYRIGNDTTHILYI